MQVFQTVDCDLEKCRHVQMLFAYDVIDVSHTTYYKQQGLKTSLVLNTFQRGIEHPAHRSVVPC